MGFIASAIGANKDGQMNDAKAMIYDQQAGYQLRLSQLASDSALNRGNAAAGALGVRTTQAIGEQQVGYASGGVDTQSGSALEVGGDTRALSEFDQATIRNNAARESWGLKLQGLERYQQGELAAFGAANNASSDRLQGMGDSAQGVMSLASQFMTGFSSGGGGGGGSSGGGGNGVDMGSSGFATNYGGSLLGS